MLGLLRDAMVKESSKTKCFLIDGYPRELEQGKRFESEVGDRGFLLILIMKASCVVISTVIL